MATPHKNRFSLDQLRTKAAEVLKTQPGVELDLGNGKSVFVVHPLFANDEVSVAVDGAKNAVDIAKAVLGEDGHALLIANGGNSTDVSLVWALLQAESEDKTADGTPTR